MNPTNYRYNPDLPFHPSLSNWKGNPHNGRVFYDPNYRFKTSFQNFLKWQSTPNPQKQEKKNDPFRLKITAIEQTDQIPNNSITWLGHASFFLKLNGVSLLVDPVLFQLPFIPRLSTSPIIPEKIGKVDYVLLTHAHRDHCDEKSIKLLYQSGRFEVLGGLGIGNIVKSWIPQCKITEAGWYQKYRLNESFSIYYLPARHWSNRFPWDTNQSLWGSFLIESASFTLFLGGDSAYAHYYKELGDMFPGIDLAILGCGAYRPEYMMGEVHMNPHQALQAAMDLKTKAMMPMHYGTFSLSDEPIGEPYRILEQAIQGETYPFRIYLNGPGDSILL